jgi:mannose-1-phosphate guanylyltransferase
MKPEDSTKDINMYAVIMAGGRGTRFWPLSREKKPKHLLNITGEKTIIQQTIARITPLIPEENILIVTSVDHYDEVKRQCPNIPERNIIAEPSGRNTAPCIGLAAMHIRKRDPESIMAVLPSDHLIENEEDFLNILTVAGKMAQRGNHLITIGIKPTGPETGYGYIERGEHETAIDGRSIYRVKSFREKPSLSLAEEFVKDGNFFWNSGTFIWSISTIINEIKKLLPDLYEGLLKIEDSIGTIQENQITRSVYDKIEPVSIDYGVMEKAPGTFLIRGNFGWSDIGSWDALSEVLDKGKSDNFAKGEIISINSSDSFIYNPYRLVALVGIKDLIVVETEDALLICKKNRSQDVKKITEELRKKGMEKYL